MKRTKKDEPTKILGVAQDISDQKKLNETMSWLCAIVDSADEAIIGKTLNCEVTSWNKAAEELYGYRSEEICGENISVLLPPDVPDDVSEIMHRVRNRERTERYHTCRKHKDGTILNVSLNVSPVIDREDNLIGASVIASREN